MKITKLPQSEVEIEGEISTEAFISYRSQALKSLNETLKIDGFRPGHIPEKVIIEKVGDEQVLLEMAEMAIKEYYPKIVEENNLDIIGRPNIQITKIALDNPLCFKIKTAIVPEVTLPDYKKIASKQNTEKAEAIEIGDEEVTKALEEIRQRSSHHHHEHKEGETCDHDHEAEVVLPEINDDWAKSIGKFDGLEDLKAKLRASIKMEKEMRAKEKHRLKIVDEIQKAAKFELSPVLIESELQKMFGELEGQIGQMGLKFDDYLTHLKKTREDLKKDWQKDAEKRVGFGLILDALTKAEKIQVPAEELDKEVDYLSTHYADADPERLRAYAETVIAHEKTFEFLENCK
ncbi:MAG: trigger factor [Candidatus Paceibacterota bacterium]